MSIYNYDDYNSNQDFPSPPQLSNPSEQVNYNQPFSEVEKEVLEIVRHLELGTETEEEYMRQVEAARVRWACNSLQKKKTPMARLRP